jgi:EmrB/QacA subfamily drug resistance transporter
MKLNDYEREGNSALMSSLDPRRWYALTVVALAQFMVVLDVTIANVALPAIRTDLGFSADGLQWVINAYTLAFGGLLLLGGRMADLLGRRRTFLAGLALFAGASLAGGLAGSPAALIAARSIQGIGGALLSPAALAIVTVTFAPGRERNLALGVWGALAGLGGTVGVVLGGLLVDQLGWQWIFFVNVPIAAIAAVAAPYVVRESRDVDARRSFDIAGALLATFGLFAVVLGVIRTDAAGWGSAQVIGLLALGAALLVAFAAVEARVQAPLLPLSLVRTRSLAVSGLALAANGGAFLGMFFLTALFLQSVQGDSALQAGVRFVPMGIAAVVGAATASQLVSRIGTRTVFIIGAAISAAGLYVLSRAGADASYLTDLLPAFVIYGVAIPFIGVPNQITAVAGVPHELAGAASGAVTAAFQIGGALGLAVITTLANTRVTDALAAGASQADALAAGFERGLVVAAILSAANLALALVAAPLVRPDTDTAIAAEVATEAAI